MKWMREFSKGILMLDVSYGVMCTFRKYCHSNTLSPLPAMVKWSKQCPVAVAVWTTCDSGTVVWISLHGKHVIMHLSEWDGSNELFRPFVFIHCCPSHIIVYRLQHTKISYNLPGVNCVWIKCEFKHLPYRCNSASLQHTYEVILTPIHAPQGGNTHVHTYVETYKYTHTSGTVQRAPLAARSFDFQVNTNSRIGAS